ncbi:MAG: hypothetical protein JNG90_09900 [Planctomycetaceae bacterium]|nr:hypothetical protein [Planctomycetaceae bacterium]
MAKFSGRLATYPARALFFWYFALITVGTSILLLPVCRGEHGPISVLDAAFTATSAVCVTGLTVRSTAHDFSFWGQLAIAGLIQVGGIGIITITTFVTLGFGRKQSLRQRIVIAETLGTRGGDLRGVLKQVFLVTAFIEGIGFVALWIPNLFDDQLTYLDGIWHAAFHSIAAFCNAGFALWDDNLMRYQTNVPVNLATCALLILGGIGFPTILDVRRNWRGTWWQRWDGLQLHSKIMLLGTTALLVGGTAAFLALEWDNVLRDLSLGDRLLVSFFQATTPRTAGFNTVDMAALTNPTLLIIMMLMFVGAGPCSTGGGAKVSTVSVLALLAWSKFRGAARPHLYRRTIPEETTDRSVTTLLIFGLIAAAALTLLLLFDEPNLPHADSHGRFLDCSFEVVSALGTVGLSTNTTTTLNAMERIVIILVMFIGRIGPISVMIALSRSERAPHFEYPKEEILIG